MRMSETGRFTRMYSVRTALVVVSVVAALLFGGAAHAVEAVPLRADVTATGVEETSAYRPLRPCRLLDTRRPTNDGNRVAPRTVRVQGRNRCGVPNNAVALAVTLAVTDVNEPGHLTAYPSKTRRPIVSTINWQRGDIRANGAIVPLGAGSFDLYTSARADLVVDVTGAFVPRESSAEGRFVPVDPMRVLDTRESSTTLADGDSVRVPVPASVPGDSRALAVTITTSGSSGAGYLTATPSGRRAATTSVLNTDGPGQIRAVGTIVTTSARGFDITASAGGDVIVDVTGYMTGPDATVSNDGLFVSETPTRLRDTRIDGPRAWPNGTVEVPIARGAAIASNVTIADPEAPGFVTAHPARRPRPGTSTVNAAGKGLPVAAFALVPVSTAGVGIYSSHGAHVVVDSVGFFTGSPSETTSPKAPNGPDAASVGCVSGSVRPIDGIRVTNPSDVIRRAHVSAPGPRGPIAVVGDSLTYAVVEETAEALRDAGWGPICIDGTGSRTVASPSQRFPNGIKAIDRIERSHAVWRSGSARWVISLGTNDVGVTLGSAEYSAELIDRAIDAIDDPRSTWWVDVRTLRKRPWPRYENVWNSALRDEPRLDVISWVETAKGHPEYYAEDGIHQSHAGNAARVDMVVDGVGGDR